MKKDFLYYLSPSVLTGVISFFLVIPLTTYYLDPRDFGIIGAITAFSALLTPCSSTGVAWVLSGNYYKLDDANKAVLVFNVLAVGLLVRFLWVLVFAGAGFFLLPRFIASFEPVFLVYFWIFLLAECPNYIWETVSFVIMIQKKAKVYAWLDVVKIVSYVVMLASCLILFKLKAIALVLGYLATALGGAAFSLIYIRKYVRWGLRREWMREISRRGLPTVPLRFIEIGTNSFSRILIERWLGLSLLGIYSHSLDYRQAFMMPQRAFMNTSAPVLLEGFSKNVHAKIAYAQRAMKKWIGLLTLGAVFCGLFAKEIVSVLTHNKFTAAAPLVSLWFVLLLVYSYGNPYTRFLLAHKKTKYLFYNEMTLGIFSFAMIAAGIRFFSITGAVMAILVHFFLLHTLRKIYALRQGCHNFEGADFYISLAAVVALLAAVSRFNPFFPVKAVFLVIAAVAIAWYYRLDFDTFRLLKAPPAPDAQTDYGEE